jgi:ubiquinone/menaquinone biosynthesis C-methylase UbiE
MDAAAEAELRRLIAATTVFAAIGALMRSRQEDTAHDPAIEAALTHLVETAVPGLLGSLDAEGEAALLRLVTVQLCDAYDLLRDPGRELGWAYNDPAMLQAQGDISRIYPRHFATMASERPDFAAAFDGGRFLDIGVGVASLALEAAALFPDLQVVGIDIWEPSLALARQHVAASPHAERVEIRVQDVTTLGEAERFTVIWFPILFFPRAVVEAALPRLAAALEPGGWLIIPRFSAPTEGLPGAVAALTALRQGGARWTDEELKALAEASGLRDVAPAPGPRFMPGRQNHLLLARK